ncbi:hypothetical protein E4L96_11790 [Massilia arenosa]|uniref:Nucleotidyltransferase family protein n=1 Tax=Zemynaea arenosa TaxID=2561931 RepID=A0A4Y9SBI7_9BURK|nr:nucleotidyltransferase family protein [Massilia arenosa]TFW19433.1 hypothetical protein E4L96_11790 [Massilia arenosa]
MTDALAIRVWREPGLLGRLNLADWDLLLRQCAETQLSGSLLRKVEDEGLLERIPAPAREHLLWTRVALERHEQAAHFELTRIRAALAEAGVELILMKGAAYLAAGLPAGRGRLFSDIDVLVPKDRLDEVEAALMLHGWATTHHDAYDQRYYRSWMHEIPPLMHYRRRSVIDVHHTILPETAPVHPDPAKLRAAAVPAAPGYRMLAPADLVLHSAVHLFFDGEFDKGLRDLLDQHRLLLHFGADPAFWPALQARAIEQELTRPLFYMLRYGARMLGTPVPEAAMAAAAQAGAPNPLLLRLMDALFLRALQPDHPSCADALTGAARFCLYVRGNWLRMPPLLLARHLFHKAFISPRQQDEQPPDLHQPEPQP